MRTLLLPLFFSLLVGCDPGEGGVDAGPVDSQSACDADAGDSFKAGLRVDGGHSFSWEQRCSAAPVPLAKGGAENALCGLADECAQVYCECSGSDKRFAASACLSSRCSDPAVACVQVPTWEPRLCL